MSEGVAGVPSTNLGPTVSSTFTTWKSSCLEDPDVSKKEKLRLEAKTFFENLVQSKEVSLNGKVVRSKSVHNEALSLMIAELGPAFSTHHYSRACALYALCGAIEGCGDHGLSLKITELLGKFLLGHCGPIQPDIDDPNEDSDELVRDAAVLCLSALIRAKMEEQDASNHLKMLESVRLRLKLSRQGVERRCAAPDSDDMEYDNGYGESAPVNDIRGGLSTLPRSRRALCFDLVRAGVDSVATNCTGDELSAMSKAQADLSSFASFAASCLHGESDPRCLMQLLQLLNALQCTFIPCFRTSLNESAFPTLDIFDAVAPYYPIQFTPPPNDVHGITRRGLHDALMAVLCHVSDEPASDTNSGENMLNLCAGLFLERLSPPDIADDTMTSTVVDKQEALEDLSALLFPSGNPSTCKSLHQDTVRELSSLLVATHANASSSATSGEDEGRRNKKLANLCRTLVSRVAYQLEAMSEGPNSLWDIFVRDTVQLQSPTLSTSPQSMRGRTAVAYLACLAASGGKRTLSVCLDSCFPPLLEVLTNDMTDEEKLAAAAYGIGALMSSCRVALERGKEDGVALHPHPLQSFGSKSIQGLCDLVGIPGKYTEDPGSDIVSFNIATRIAAIRSMESALLTTPSTVLEPDDLTRICSLFDMITDALMQDNDVRTENHSMKTNEESDFSSACARTLGSVIGVSLLDCDTDGEEMTKDVSYSCVLNDNSTIRGFVRDSIYPKILSSALSDSKLCNKEESRRYDWMSLGLACEISCNVSKLVVSELLECLRSALKHDGEWESTSHPAVAPATALSCVLSRGGTHAINAFHEASSPGASAIDVIDALSSAANDATEITNAGASFKRENLQTGARVSMLELPSTEQELDAIENAVELVYEIVPNLLPAYQRTVPVANLLRLAKYALKVLPPLSDTENIKLDVMLPLLCAALSNDTGARNASAADSETLDGVLASMACPLSEYVLSSTYDARARSAAASCLHAIIANYQPTSSKECLAHVVMKKVVLPAVVAAADIIDNSKVPLNQADIAAFKDALNLTALLGSAAACRGKKSSKTADEIAKFLIQFACTGKADAPVNMDISKLGGNKRQEWTAWPAPLTLAASSAFGSMLSVENGGPFWRQRLSHLAMKPVLQACSRESSRFSGVSSLPPLGPLLISCHIVCSNNITAIGKSEIGEVVSIVLWGLTTVVKSHPGGDGVALLTDVEYRSIVALLLATITKLMAVAPGTISNYVSVIVPNFLLLFVEEDQHGAETIPLQLLVLQGLLNLSHLHSAKRNLIQFKPAIVSLLAGALDHPSALLRQAAVDVSNSWSVLTG